jgi:membrane associated rhomboid family serine protease
MDLNHILLFIAIASPLIVLVQLRAPGRKRGWRMISAAVLLMTIAAWLLLPALAGYLGGCFWLAFLFLPAIGLRRVADLVAQQRYSEARRVMNLARVLHPTDDVREQARLVHALELAQRGGIESAIAHFSAMRSDATSAGRQATAQIFRLRGDWNGLLAWCRALPPEIFRQDHALLPLYFRALGETNALDDLVSQFSARAQVLEQSPQASATLNFSLVMVFAFCGRTNGLVRLFSRELSKWPDDTKEFWIGTSELAAGKSSAARERFEQLLAASHDAVIRRESAERLTRVSGNFRPALAPWNEKVIERFQRRSSIPHSSFMSQTMRVTPVVLILVALNAAMFLIESVLGGSTNELTLHWLGALEPATVIFRGEYWRLFTALFLHYGALHLFVNLYALYVLGPPLESSIGAIRFAACYLISGIGSGLGVVLLRFFAVTSSDQLVGASGSVMGVVGAWAGLLLRHRHLPTSGHRLRNILIIVLMQTAFDLWAPQVSMTAHLSGLVTGLIVGFLLAPPRGRT